VSVSNFARDVLLGLNSKPKHLFSKYFYDKKGSELFQSIMRMPEYYLTDCEMEIFGEQKEDIYRYFASDEPDFDLLELGAGDGLKTKILLQYFSRINAKFRYVPIDISSDVVINLTEELSELLPDLTVEGMIGDYFQMMDDLNSQTDRKKILLFLGSNIGNYDKKGVMDFLVQVRSVMRPADYLFIGFDLKKDPRVILRAYDDPKGITAAFNLNLLSRINRELGGNFNTSFFEHIETYDPETGAARSFLISTRDQEIFLQELNAVIHFEKNESIYMEISKKFDLPMIQNLAKKTGFEIVRNFMDHRQYFMNSLWKRKQ
jgi:L-histidine N-alpha-methyltransferase